MDEAYSPAYQNFDRLVAENFKGANELAAWRMDIMTKWGFLDIRNVRAETHDQLYIDESILVQAEVQLGGIRPEDIRVEIYSGPVAGDRGFISRTTTIMQPDKPTADGWMLYHGEAMPTEAGQFGFTVRILPNHPLLLDPHSLGLIRWAGA